jgi:hypothetical protein
MNTGVMAAEYGSADIVGSPSNQNNTSGCGSANPR